MALIQDLQLSVKTDPQLARDLTKAWRDMINQVNNLLTVYHQATRPVIPDGTMSLWHDTGNSKYFLVANFGQGVFKTVELT